MAGSVSLAACTTKKGGYKNACFLGVKQCLPLLATIFHCREVESLGGRWITSKGSGPAFGAIVFVWYSHKNQDYRLPIMNL
jgi:hypothetical protein